MVLVLRDTVLWIERRTRNEEAPAPRAHAAHPSQVRPPLREVAPHALNRTEGVPPLARRVPARSQLRLGQYKV